MAQVTRSDGPGNQPPARLTYRSCLTVFAFRGAELPSTRGNAARPVLADARASFGAKQTEPLAVATIRLVFVRSDTQTARSLTASTSCAVWSRPDSELIVDRSYYDVTQLLDIMNVQSQEGSVDPLKPDGS